MIKNILLYFSLCVVGAWALLHGMTFLFYAISLGTIYVLVSPILNKSKKKRVRAMKNADREHRNKQELAALVAEQVALEDAETKTKASNNVIPIKEYFRDPAKFHSVIKYRLKFVDLGGVYYEKERIKDLVFFPENKFEVTGIVRSAYYGAFLPWVFVQSEKTGYDVRPTNGFQLEVEVASGGKPQRMFLNVLYNFESQPPKGKVTGYEPAKNVTPWEVFANCMGAGAEIRATGDLVQRLKDLYAKGETEDNRHIQPAGMYLTCTPQQIEFI